MEPDSKRLKELFNSYFPSDEEIRHLEETFQWDKLSKRLYDRTALNAVKSAQDRDVSERTGILSRDVLYLILLKMPAGDVLDLATKSSSITKIINDDQFWLEKLKRDFPEMIYPLKMYQLSKGWDEMTNHYKDEIEPVIDVESGEQRRISILERIMTQTTQFRGVYMVFRLWLTRVRREVLEAKEKTIGPNSKLTYTYSASKQAQPIITHFNNPPRLTQDTQSFQDAYNVLYGESASFYLEDILSSKITLDEETTFRFKIFLKKLVTIDLKRVNFFGPPKWELDMDDNHWYRHKLIWGSVNLPDAIKRGYILEKDGKPVIGQEICSFCKEEEPQFRAGCCEQRQYCSHVCAQKDWKEHQEICKI